jgi:hypothetical protein
MNLNHEKLQSFGGVSSSAVQPVLSTGTSPKTLASDHIRCGRFSLELTQ